MVFFKDKMFSTAVQKSRYNHLLRTGADMALIEVGGFVNYCKKIFDIQAPLLKRTCVIDVLALKKYRPTLPNRGW